MPSIYLLIDPRDASVRYVGWCGNSLRRRLLEHVREAAKGVQTYKCCWLRALITVGVQPTIWLVESTEAPKEREKYWIAHYRSAGCRLTNGTDGGDGQLGSPRSAETRTKISAALRGMKKGPMPAERRAELSAKLKGRSVSGSHRQALQAAARERSKLQGEQSSEVIRLHTIEGLTVTELAARFKVNRNVIHRALPAVRKDLPHKKLGPREDPSKYQGENNGRAVLNWEKVRSLRAEAAFTPRPELVLKYGIGLTGISKIIRGSLWKDPGYIPILPVVFPRKK